MAPETLTAGTPVKQSKSHKEKSSKSHKSSENKKRKRDREHGDDSERRKKKKHRKDKTHHGEVAAAQLIAEETSESPFHTQTSTLYLPLAPISQRTPLEGMCAEHLSPLILTYYPPFDGVVLSYSNPRLSEQNFGDDGRETLLQCIDEFGVSYAWVTAEFLIFKPQRGGQLEGYINLQNEGHLGLVCWNLFNASIERQRLPQDWKWVGLDEADVFDEDPAATGMQQYAADGIGHYVDGKGDKIEGIIKFAVKDIESSHDRERGFLSIEGTMLNPDDEKSLSEKELASKGIVKGKTQRTGGSRALGATSLGVTADSGGDALVVDRTKKHKHAY